VASVLQQCKAARKAMRGGNRAEAAGVCRDILKHHPNCLFAHRLLAVMEVEANTRDALLHLQQCATIDPEDPLPEIGCAIVTERAGVSESAIQHFRRAAELDPEDERILGELERLRSSVEETELARGILELREGDIASATATLTEALNLRADDQAARLALARALWTQGQTEQAVGQAQLVLAVNAHSIVALMLLLAAEQRRGRALRVRELQMRVDAIDPGFLLHQEIAAQLGLSATR
jgi:Flp pilus assembly protein TadD